MNLPISYAATRSSERHPQRFSFTALFRLLTRSTGLASILLLLNAPALTFAQQEEDVRVYLTVEEALLEVFPDSRRYITESVVWNEEAWNRAQKALNRKGLSAEHEIVLNYDASGRFIGYSVITEEIGKYRPITFIVGITPDFEVENVAVMVYRESRGGEVRTPRFLYQYRGKSASDAIRINRDIINITGATISVRSINAGVRKVLYLVNARYRDQPPASTFEQERESVSSHD